MFLTQQRFILNFTRLFIRRKVVIVPSFNFATILTKVVEPETGGEDSHEDSVGGVLWEEERGESMQREREGRKGSPKRRTKALPGM